MITMVNVLKRGRTTWDRTLLPEDEYVERTRVLRELMRGSDLDVLVSLGHVTRPGNFTYLSGYVPPLGWMGTVLGLEEGPVLVSGGGSREIPFVQTQTWIADLRTSRSLFTGPAEVVADAVGGLAGDSSRVGIAGAYDALNAGALAELGDALQRFATVDADDLLAGARAVKRPRELVALRRAQAVAQEAVDTAVARHAEGASDTEALLAAEKVGRIGGCRDVMVLGSIGDGQLAPVQELSGERSAELTAFCSVERLGYWGQAAASTGSAAAATAAVEAMVAATGAGVETADVARAAYAHLSGGSGDIALSYGLGAGIGLDPTEGPAVSETAGGPIPAGQVLALQAFTTESGVLTGATETVHVTEGGVSRL